MLEIEKKRKEKVLLCCFCFKKSAEKNSLGSVNKNTGSYQSA